MKIKRYLALTRAGILESFQYRLAMLVMIAGNLLYLIVVYFFWKAVYASSGSDVVNGMTFSDTLIYLVLATALFNFMEMYTVWEIGRNIQSGKIPQLSILVIFRNTGNSIRLYVSSDLCYCVHCHERSCTSGSKSAVFCSFCCYGGYYKLCR